MEKGIYDPYGSFYAPYYRQVGLNVYEMPLEDRETYLELAYADVKAAFLYYLENDNQGRPILLAGFSQGADLCLRLLKDCFADPAVNDLLVACYAIGWRITQEELAAYPHLRFAEGEQDTGAIIAFNSEAEDVNDPLLVPAGIKSLCINPLNWRTDGAPADKAENLGACFTDYSGAIVTEIPQLTGAYIDETRGTLKVPDVNPEDYPPVLSLFDQGVYHLYDYQFFYRNCRRTWGNVWLRIFGVPRCIRRDQKNAGPLTWIMPAARPLHFICGDNSSRDAPPESDGNLPFHIRSWRTCKSRWLRKHPLSLQSMRLARRLWAVPSSRIHQIGWHRDEIHNADNTLIALCRPPFRGSLRLLAFSLCCTAPYVHANVSC